MSAETIPQKNVDKGKLMEYVVMEILSEIQQMLTASGKPTLSFAYNRLQGGNGRGKKGRTIDSLMVAPFEYEKKIGMMSLFIEIKNLGKYPIKATIFKTKFLDKVRDTKKKLQKAGFGDVYFVFVGYFELTKGKKKRLMDKGVMWFVLGKGDLKLNSSQDEIEEYKINLRCEFLQMLDVLYPSLLEDVASQYVVHIIDEYKIALENENGILPEIDLREIEPDSNYFVGPRPIDFFSWRKTPDGITSLLHPWINKDGDYDSEKVKEIKANVMNGRSLGQISWRGV